MGSVNETVKTINSSLRTLLMIVLVAGAAYGGYVAYDLYHRPQEELAEKQAELDKFRAQTEKELAARQQEITDLNVRLDETTAQVERLEVALRLLKVRRRLARIKVLDQRTDAESGRLTTRIEFSEINDEGQPIGEAKQFDIVGNLVYVDYLRVTFDDKYIEASDLDRSTAICLFQRIFGEHQQAADGFQIDRVGTRPTAYARGTDMSDFERKIWSDFWTIANNPQRAESLGIHAAHEVALGVRAEPNKTYEIELRATGDMTVRPIEATRDRDER
jgi:hypothetical protein